MARAIDPTVGDGLLVVDKPAGWTSHGVVGACRRIAGTRKVGHAGTLDPMATGVLVVGVNRATRLLTFLVGCDKAYTATIRLGRATVTDDAEGDVTATARPKDVSALDTAGGAARVDAAVAALIGDLAQVPSAVSAIKIDGKRSYARVRAGEDVELAGRAVHVSRFVVTGRRLAMIDADTTQSAAVTAAIPAGRSESAAVPTDPTHSPGLAHDVVLDLDVEVEVSSGTYVRALARDLGHALGVGGHLTALRRTRVGGITLAAAHTMAEIEAARAGGAPRPESPEESAAALVGTSGLPLVPLAEAARGALPARELDEGQAFQVGHGVRIPSAQPGRAGPVAAFGPGGELVAVLDESGERVMPSVVFAPGA